MAGGFCPEVLPTSSEIEYNKGLSTILYRMLENYGVTTELRDIHTERASLMERFCCLLQNEVYIISGSQYEGTSARQTGSDLDVIRIDQEKPVVSNISNCPHPVCFLLLPEQQPGYFKLQPTLHGKPISNDIYPLKYEMKFFKLNPIYCLKFDKDQRLCLIQQSADKQYIGHAYMHGPSFYYPKHFHGVFPVSTDYVWALKGKDWPECASEWVIRQREHGWPSEDLIKKCKTYGFLVVNTCHPASGEKEFQWRISFTLQERLLVTQFNSVQLKCYMLLKRIKKQIIEPQIKEETLTSYHCKTCMFYLLENTPSKLWIPENLVTCLLMCLRQLLIYVRNNNCPNYFIPGENMFDRITSGKQREHLRQILERITDLNSQAFGTYLANQNFQYRDFASAALQAKWCANAQLTLLQKYALNTCFGENNPQLPGDFQYCLKHKLDEVKEATIPYHTRAETDQAKSIFLPFIKVHLLSCNLVCALSTGNETPLKILTSKEWDQQAPIAGYSKLKQAAAMLMLKHYETAIDILLSITDNKRFSCCGCNPLTCYFPLLQELQDAVGNRPYISITELLNNFFQLCVNFLPFEKEITPTALQYEMVRDFGMPPFPFSFYKHVFFWHEWGVVDGNFLFHFLLYLNYQALGKISKAKHHIMRMIQLLNKKCVSHRETCLNLLGWAYKERGDIDRAVQCFRKSLETRHKHNAACCHLCFLMCGY